MDFEEERFVPVRIMMASQMVQCGFSGGEMAWHYVVIQGQNSMTSQESR